MAETSTETSSEPFIPKHTRRTVIVLGYLLVYSVAMFTLPFVAFFGMRHIISEYYPGDTFKQTVWSVASAVVMVNLIIFAYAYKAYHEKEYDEHGKEIDQHSYEPAPAAETERSSLNIKQD